MPRLLAWSAACLLGLSPVLQAAGDPKESARVDPYGDPLPAGVLARLGSVRLDCEDTIRSAVFAPDGKSLSVATTAQKEQLWFLDVNTGRTLRRLSLPEGVEEHALTPDRRFLVVRTFTQKDVDPTSAGVVNFREIHVVDAATGKQIWKTDARPQFGSLALSADGKLLAAGTIDESGGASDIFLWDLATGEPLRVLKGHATPVRTLAFSADGKKLLSASVGTDPRDETRAIEGSIRIWQLPDGKLLRQSVPAGSAVVFSPNGRTAAFHDVEATKLRLWDLDTDREIAAWSTECREYLFSPDGQSFVTGSSMAMLRLWDAATGREARSFQGLVGNGTRPLAFSPDGRVLASCSDSWSGGHAIRLWDVARGTELRPFGGHHLDLTCLAFSADGRKLISGSEDRTARIWEVAKGKELVLHEQHRAGITAVAFSPDGRLVASGDRDGVTHIWDSATGKLLQHLPFELQAPQDTRPVMCILSFAPDGRTLWVGSQVFAILKRLRSEEKGELALYDTATGERIQSIRRDLGYPLAVSADGRLSVWTERFELTDETGRPLDRWREKLVVRRLDTGRELLTIALGIDRLGEEVTQAVFSPDGRLLALNSSWLAESFTRSENVPCYRLVEVASGRDIVSDSQIDYPWTLFTPEGRVLAGSHRIFSEVAPISGPFREQRSSIRVVDAVTGQAQGDLPGHPMTTNPWALSPNGKFFASANTNHTILVWDLTQQGLKPPTRRKAATRDELERLWTDLASDDAKDAWLAVADLAAVPAQSVPFLCERLKPVVAPPPRPIANHIKDLESDDFETRRQAQAALEKLGELAEPALRRVLDGKPSPETRERVEQILDKLNKERMSSERVRAARAVTVLERAGTTEARDHLARLAVGAPEARLTQEAQASLQRLPEGAPK